MTGNNTGASARCAKHPSLTGCMMSYDDLPSAIRAELGDMAMNYCPACIKQALNQGSPDYWMLGEMRQINARDIERHRTLYARGV